MYGKVNGASRRVWIVAAGLALVLAFSPGTARNGRAQAPADTDPASSAQAPTAPAKSVVYEVRDSRSVSHYAVDPARVHAMVDRLVMAVTGKESVASAWRSLVDPKDIVGIKINASGGDLGSTHRAVVEAIIDGLRDAGMPTGNILVWDRDAAGLQTAGYLDYKGRSTLPVAVEGIEPKIGYDPKEVYTTPSLGKLMWGDLQFKGNAIPADFELRADDSFADPLVRNAAPTPDPRSKNAQALADQNLSNASHYANILSRRVTKIVNVPFFSDNYFAGLGGALYNATIPNVDNWRRLVGPPRYGVQAIPELYSDPRLGGKIVINIMDGLVAQIAGGPYFQPLYARNYATLYASKDAVALDSVALRLIEGWRVQAQLPKLGDTAAHVKTAAEVGLGNFAPEKIDLRVVNP